LLRSPGARKREEREEKTNKTLENCHRLESSVKGTRHTHAKNFPACLSKNFKKKKKKTEQTRETERERAEDHARRSVCLSFSLSSLCRSFFFFFFFSSVDALYFFTLSVKSLFWKKSALFFGIGNLKHSRAKFFQFFLHIRAREPLSLSLSLFSLRWKFGRTRI
jgi:hypothetical protein